MMLPAIASSQNYNQIDEEGNISQVGERNRNFNPHNNDTTSNNIEVPKGIYVWTVDRKFGDIRRTEVDTIPHLYPQSTMGPGMYGEYNTIGSNYTARQSRIFANRRTTSQSLFLDSYSQILRQPGECICMGNDTTNAGIERVCQ